MLTYEEKDGKKKKKRFSWHPFLSFIPILSFLSRIIFENYRSCLVNDFFKKIYFYFKNIFQSKHDFFHTKKISLLNKIFYLITSLNFCKK